jgi:catechol 2,3-dioxygenase-like lactoylglutathione lyase family enzyme
LARSICDETIYGVDSIAFIARGGESGMLTGGEMGLPGLAGADHIGITVPDLEAVTRFFVDVIGRKVTFEVGPFASDDDWMQQHLGVDPRSKINKLRMLKCANGPSIELFEYDVKDQKNAVPKNSDVGGHHVGFYVTDLDAAVAHLRRNGVKVLGEPTLMNEGPSAGLRWLYFVSPWGMTMELVSYPRGMAYEAGTDDILWRPA